MKSPRLTRRRITAFDVFNYTLLGLIAFACIYPFYYIVIFSISDPTKTAQGVFLWPQGISFDSYRGLLAGNDILNAFAISLSRTVLGTALTVVCCAFLAYLVSKREMYFRKTVYRLVIITMYLNAGLIPWYLTMKAYGLKDNYLLYVVPGAVVAFFVILIKTYIEQLPESIEESAAMDGAGYFTIFTRIIFPLTKPIVATIAVYAAVGNWNSWYDNYFLVNDSNLQTLQLLLYNYLSQAESLSRMTTQELSLGNARVQVTPESIKMSITVIVSVPILFAYPFLQRNFVRGIMMGAVKG